MQSEDAALLKQLISTKEDNFNDVEIYKKLLDTVRDIAQNGSATFYEGGAVGRQLVHDLGQFTKDWISYWISNLKKLKIMYSRFYF